MIKFTFIHFDLSKQKGFVEDYILSCFFLSILSPIGFYISKKLKVKRTEKDNIIRTK